jgi:chromosome segregation ATPase
MRRELSQLQLNLSESKAAAVEARQVAERDVESVRAEWKAKLSAAHDAHENATCGLKLAHESQIKDLKEAFEDERKQLLAKIKQLQRVTADLEYKYANRESREEDVQKINQLLKEAKEKDEALLKAYNDMKFYKLELVNREENYNKTFGRTPTVASGPHPPAAAEQTATSAVKTNHVNPATAPAKMDPSKIPPNVKRKSMGGEST